MELLHHGRIEQGRIEQGRIERGPGTGKVILMERFRSGRSVSPIRQAEAYWHALRKDGEVPYRAQIDPRGLGNVLEYAFILERIAPGLARFRLAGHHLTGLAGMEVRGMPVSALFTAATRGRFAALLEQVFATPAVAELTLAAQPRRGPARAEARMLLLPLKSDTGEVSRALGILIAEGATGGPTPWRLDLTDADLRPVVAVQPATDKAEPVAPGFAEAQSPLTGKVPHLRVVK